MREIEEISEEEFLSGVKGASFVPLTPQEIMFPSTGGQSMVRFDDKNKCPECNIFLVFKHCVVADWPYTHVDLKLECSQCGLTFLFGVPREPLFGMELIVWDSKPETVIKQAFKLERPVCSFHKIEMKLTKIWGNLVMVNPDEIRVQWKCPHSSLQEGFPTCYLTNHLTVQRIKTVETKSDGQLRKKLKDLGYL